MISLVLKDKKKLSFVEIVCCFFILMGLSSCSVLQLQDGLVAPSEAVRSAASKEIAMVPSPNPITLYNNFSVSVNPDIAVTVYSRERAGAIANIMMVHGAGSGAWAWEVYFDLLPETYNLYALSWRGHFDSTPVQDADSYDYVKDQRAVLDAIGLRNALPIHVIGHSYGGATSVMLVSNARTKTQVSSLHLIAPVVSLDYTLAQKLIIPTLAPPFIRQSTRAGNDVDGVYGGMFLARERMKHYHALYAGKDYSIERPSLIAKDGVSARWQTQL